MQECLDEAVAEDMINVHDHIVHAEETASADARAELLSQQLADLQLQGTAQLLAQQRAIDAAMMATKAAETEQTLQLQRAQQ